MKFMRTVRWYLPALLVCGILAQQLAVAQIPVGTTRTGTFVWDGNRWIPAEEAPAPPPQMGAAVEVGGVELSVNEEPPPLPVYVQPPCPQPDLIWTPGYWHHGFLGFYWVPGAWVPAPYAGALWTPGYWGFAGGVYGFHTGYWGPHIGFYGGVNYGGGYMGIGFAGGSWNGGHFAYNTAVVNVNRVSITNVYVNKTIVEQTTIVNTGNASYNGGPHGVQHEPTPEEQTASHETHTPPTSFQKQHVTAAAADKSNLASANGGHPKNVAETKPLAAETHAPPAGFKPEPARPMTELAKAQAPPSTVAAAKTATAKTATVAKPAQKATTPMNAGSKPPAPAGKTATTPPAKTVPKPETSTAPKATAPKSEGTAPPKSMPKSETSAPKTTTPKPEGKPATTPPAKTVPKPANKPKPEDKNKKPE